MEFYLICIICIIAYILINVLVAYIFFHYIADDYEPYSIENPYDLSDYLMIFNITIVIIYKLFEEGLIPYIKNKLKYLK